MNEQEIKRLVDEKTKLLMIRMEYQIVYGVDFFEKTPEMQRVIIFTDELESRLKNGTL